MGALNGFQIRHRGASARSQIGSDFACPRDAVMRFTMRLVGKLKLADFVRRVAPSTRSAAAALLAELESAEWLEAKEACAAYPSADSNGCRLSISLDDDHCVDVAINYQAGIILIEFAGRCEDRNQIQPVSRRRTIS